jgi:hypothetical protein
MRSAEDRDLEYSHFKMIKINNGAKHKRNDEIQLKYSSFLLKGRRGLRVLCAPVEGCC